MQTTQNAKLPEVAFQVAHDLDSLAALDSEALARLYAEAPTPRSLTPLAGHPRGRMLALRGLASGALLASALRRFAGAEAFPWGGKSFFGGGDAGTGVNRVHLARGGRHNLFPFETSIAPSVMDGRAAIVLDYDLADNPWLIRQIHDEVREVSPGVYLGPAMWKRAGQGPGLVLWFALDTNTPSRGIGARL